MQGGNLRRMMREERRSRRRCLSVWVALSQVEDPGVSPPLSLYHSIPLSFSLFTSPGGLHHLIWINEKADLHLTLSLSIALLLNFHRDERIVFTQTASTSASVSTHLHFRWNLFHSCSLPTSQIPPFFILPHPIFIPYLNSWPCMCVCVSLGVCMCNSALPALLTDKALLFILGTTCVSSPTTLFGWSERKHALLRSGTHTHIHTYRNPRYHISSREVCLCTSTDTHNQAVGDLICGESF